MRLVGDDLELVSYEYVKDIIGDSLSELRSNNDVTFPAFFIIKDVTADEIFFLNHKKGDIYYSLNGTEILSQGTVFEYIKESNILADIKSFNMSLSYSEIELTTIDDEVSKYDKAIQSCSGSIAFQVSSENMAHGELINRFIKMSYVDNRGINTIKYKNNTDLFIRGLVNKLDDINKKILLFAKIELFNYNLVGNMGAAQDFTSNYRLKDLDPLLFVIEE